MEARKMKHINSSRAGQLSFDMAFAIIAIIMVSGMLINYFNISVWSHEGARRMFALNIVADTTYSKLNSLYTSLIGASGNASLSIDFPVKYLAGGSPGTEYEINYTVLISVPSAAGATFTFNNQADPLLSTSRLMGFVVECKSSPMPTSVVQGDRIRLQDCKISTGHLKCEKCSYQEMQTNKKIGIGGQTALETMFVMLFIVIAIGGIFAQTLSYGLTMQKMSEARVVAQGVAMELSVNGTYTHIVRVDYNGTTAGNVSVNLYLVSENCNLAKNTMSNRIGSVLGAGAVKFSTCGTHLYNDTKL
jgi:hypothetical protein